PPRAHPHTLHASRPPPQTPRAAEPPSRRVPESPSRRVAESANNDRTVPEGRPDREVDELPGADRQGTGGRASIPPDRRRNDSEILTVGHRGVEHEVVPAVARHRAEPRRQAGRNRV